MSSIQGFVQCRMEVNSTGRMEDAVAFLEVVFFSFIFLSELPFSIASSIHSLFCILANGLGQYISVQFEP